MSIVAIVVLAVAVWLLPLVVLFVGLVVAVVGVGARVLSLAAWTVTAQTGATRLAWRVRGVRRSRRAMRDVATALARGVTPAVDGIPGTAGWAAGDDGAPAGGGAIDTVWRMCYRRSTLG